VPRAQVRSFGICGGQGGTGVCFLLPIVIPPTAPLSSSIIRGWYNRPVSGRRTKWTQSHPSPRKQKKIINSICLKMLNLAGFKFFLSTPKNESPRHGFPYIFVQLSDHIMFCTCFLFFHIQMFVFLCSEF
jgi:hypothetical protein